jgi:hypothetical protein
MKSIHTSVRWRNLFLAAFASLIGISSTAMGVSMVLTASAEKPSGNIICETTVNPRSITSTRSNTESNPPNRWNGATFTLREGYKVNSISFVADCVYKDFTGTDIELLLVDMTGKNVAYGQPVVLGKVLKTYSTVAEVEENFPKQVWLTFDIAGLTLNAGDYAVVLTLPGNSVRGITTYAAADESISKGIMSTDKGARYAGSGAPIAFIIRGTPLSSAK